MEFCCVKSSSIISRYLSLSLSHTHTHTHTHYLAVQILRAIISRREEWQWTVALICYIEHLLHLTGVCVCVPCVCVCVCVCVWCNFLPGTLKARSPLISFSWQTPEKMKKGSQASHWPSLSSLTHVCTHTHTHRLTHTHTHTHTAHTHTQHTHTHNNNNTLSCLSVSLLDTHTHLTYLYPILHETEVSEPRNPWLGESPADMRRPANNCVLCVCVCVSHSVCVCERERERALSLRES